jgi:hypothetical protein
MPRMGDRSMDSVVLILALILFDAGRGWGGTGGVIRVSRV